MAFGALSKGCLIAAVLCCMAFGNSEGQAFPPPKRLLGATEQEAVNLMSYGIRNFTIELLYHTAQNIGNHLVISPFSVWAILSIIAEGAAGNTYEELSRKLRLQEPNIISIGYPIIDRLFNVNTPTIELATISKLYCDSNLKINHKYETFIGDTYRASVSPVKFQNTQQAAKQINNDVERATNGKIHEIVNEEDMEAAKMIITNAVFFKGQWTMPFNASQTEESPFFDENGKKLGVVNMMYQKGPFAFINFKKFQSYILELPYGKEDRLSMLVMLPYAKVPLVQMFQNLAVVSLEELFVRLKEAAEQAEDDDVEVWLPRFRIETDVVMNKPLNDLGIYEVFDHRYSELPKISKNAYLSRVIHKAVIEVTEQGTEASAVTAGKLYDRSFPPKFKANRPFVYFIIEKTTNIIVFSGIYSKPIKI